MIPEAEAHARWLVDVHDGSVAVPGVPAGKRMHGALFGLPTTSGSPRLVEGKGVTSQMLEGKGVTSQMLEDKGVTSQMLEDKGVTSQMLEDEGVTSQMLEDRGASRTD